MNTKKMMLGLAVCGFISLSGIAQNAATKVESTNATKEEAAPAVQQSTPAVEEPAGVQVVPAQGQPEAVKKENNMLPRGQQTKQKPQSAPANSKSAESAEESKK